MKYAAWRLGIIGSPECRLPLAPIAERPRRPVDDGAGRASACCTPRPPSSAGACTGEEVGHGAPTRTTAASALPRTARRGFEYRIEDTYEAGIELTGTEVKSLRVGQANIAESYA